MYNDIDKKVEYAKSLAERIIKEQLINSKYALYIFSLLQRIIKTSDACKILFLNKFVVELYSCCKGLYEHVFLMAEVYSNREDIEKFHDRIEFSYYKDRFKLSEIRYCTSTSEKKSEMLCVISEKVGSKIKKFNDTTSWKPFMCHYKTKKLFWMIL